MAPMYQQNQQTTAPCLLKLFASCWENVTSSKPGIAANLSCDYNRMCSKDPPASQSASASSNSSIATGLPHAELAALIASIVDERMNRPLIQDGGASNAQLTRPSPPSNLQDSLKTERDCSHRQLFRPLWGSSVWRNNQRSGSDEKYACTLILALA